MTKEELRKEAEDVVCGMMYDTYESDGHSDFAVEDILVKFTEPREKRIEELELKIKKLTQHLEPQTMTALFEQVEEEVKQEQRLNELGKENAELKERNAELKGMYAHSAREAGTYKQFFEKMKCCGNCKHFDFNEPNYCNKGVYRERQYVCNKWEFMN